MIIYCVTDQPLTTCSHRSVLNDKFSLHLSEVNDLLKEHRQALVTILNKINLFSGNLTYNFLGSTNHDLAEKSSDLHGT